MTNELLMQEIKSMSEFDAEKNNLAKASIVKIRQNRTCIECKKTIKACTEAITASHMTDKRYDVTLKDLYTYDCMDIAHFSFVPVRHWMCTSCAEKIVNKYMNKRNTTPYKRHTHNDELRSLYERGEITAKEWDDEEMAEIHQYAFEQAVGIGQA